MNWGQRAWSWSWSWSMVKVWVFHEAVVPPTDRGVNTKPKDRERVAL